MKIRSSSYFLIGIIVLMSSLGLYSLKYASIRMSAVPFIACGLVVVLAAIALRNDLIQGAKEKEATEQEKEAAGAGRSETRKYLRALSWTAGLVAAIYLAGFLIATALFIFAYLKFEGRSGWLISIASSAVTTVLIYAIFVLIMQVDLFPGIFFGE
jgi:biotin transporter BioY